MVVTCTGGRGWSPTVAFSASCRRRVCVYVRTVSDVVRIEWSRWCVRVGPRQFYPGRFSEIYVVEGHVETRDEKKNGMAYLGTINSNVM